MERCQNENEAFGAHEGEWVPVTTTSSYEIAKDKYNSVTFETVKTTSLKLAVQLPVDNAGGIQEWIVE